MVMVDLPGAGIGLVRLGIYTSAAGTRIGAK
jgi:hypothetical protein